MAPMHHSDEGIERARLLRRLEELYRTGFVKKDEYQSMPTVVADASLQGGTVYSPKEFDPSTTIPRILSYLRDNDADRDGNWNANFPLIRGYIAEASQQMTAGALGYSDPKLRAALEDARVMISVHLASEKRDREKTPWTTDILRGQTTQERLLSYPEVFPLPEPNRAKSQYRPVDPIPRPKDNSTIWNTTLKAVDPTTGSSVLAEVDEYVESEDRFFQAVRNFVKIGETNNSTWNDNKFITENRVYEQYIRRGIAETRAKVVPPYDSQEIAKGPSFYNRRGWQRAALQQCLNLFTSHENRVINTPWRRLVLPYEPPAPLPKDTVYVPRVVDPKDVNEKEKDPFSWLYWSSKYAETVDWLADSQRRRYNSLSWNDFSVSALPVNFRGPRIYRGFAVHDQHWLRIGEQLENIESLLHSAWGAAPRPLLRAILRDIDAGRQENTGGPNMNNSLQLPAEDDDDIHDRKRYWRRDIKRRLGIDNIKDNTDDDNYKLVDDVEISWLKYLCEPSRTLEMCDPSKLPTHNLAIVFDAKLQSFFKNLELSGVPDSRELYLWGEDRNDIHEVMHAYEPKPLTTVLAYINGCAESELKQGGDTDPNPEHPNSCYQFSMDEAEFCCIELQQLGRCVFIPGRGGKPARVDRPSYNVHPEDRVMWRYEDLQHLHETNAEYLADMLDHYDTAYGNWSLYHENRPRFARELEFILDHAGSDFSPELERLETQEKHPGTATASAKRRAFIEGYLVPEGLCRVGNTLADSADSDRDPPLRDDLATWEAVGAYLKKYHEQVKKQHKGETYYYSGEPYYPQTPERTAQFFRNIAYRMGRTLRYVDQVKERLQYLENGPKTGTMKPPLDLSAHAKKPRPENNVSADPGPTLSVVEKWWQAISTSDYDLAIEKWSTAVTEGSGEVALMPPDIKEVLARADPDSTFQNPLKQDQDPFTIIREGIIDDCFRNRPTMYPGRLSGFKDEEDKEFQGYERPNLFVWATKDQRRYQAQHTRQHFFNMQRWPPSRILPHRLDAIRERKDEVLRTDPSRPDQAYGILTNRLPIGNEKPLYAHPIIDHHHGRDPEDWHYLQPDSPRHINPAPSVSLDSIYGDSSTGSSKSSKAGNNTIANNKNIISVNTVTIDPVNINPFSVNLFNDNAGGSSGNNTTSNNMPLTGKKGTTGHKGTRRLKGGLIPFRRTDEKFAPGPAIFPMGDTLLQKVMISNELNRALYPARPFYKDPLLGLSRVWKKVAGGEVPLIPLVPPVARSNIPRSNPSKRKMPIEFLNSSATTKRFRSDTSVPLQPGGSGGQFAAATAVGKKAESTVKGEPLTEVNTGVKAEYGTGQTDKINLGQIPAIPGSGSTTSPPSLPVYPEPDKREAKRLLLQTFPNRYISTRSTLHNMSTSALIALEYGINYQLGKKTGLYTTNKELVSLLRSEACAAIAPYANSKDNFDIHCLNLLAQVWGETHGYKVQLGVVHEDAAQAIQMKEAPNSELILAAYLVGSKYDKATDKFVVWVRLTNAEDFEAKLLNPYNKLPYNNYRGLVDQVFT
ncbi:hypothetical protein F5Y12DRAFT_718382 [Xylaria sp. FL1777]|nr:hypothetical protein F5Y12DRAFT_718382 [Xylaria sp. FL1777]